jgi:3D (Asp-Asp-Asp) domain-containing protein
MKLLDFLKPSSLKIYLLKIAFQHKGVYVLFVAIVIATFCLPKISSLANCDINPTNTWQKIQYLVSQNFKPQKETFYLYVTAYSSTLDQTDETPCIAASGYNLCHHDKENVVACNFLPFGTKVIFPELDPEKIYTVVDRMHERFNSRLDIWMQSRTKATEFGLKYLKVEIYK